jgi:hypothetical protein
LGVVPWILVLAGEEEDDDEKRGRRRRFEWRKRVGRLRRGNEEGGVRGALLMV